MIDKNIKHFRKAKGMSQEEMAVKLNVVRQTVSKWENGLSVPDADVLIRMAELLNVSVSQLLGIEAKDQSDKDLSEELGQFTRNYTQTVKRAADNKRRYAPGWVHSTCLLRGFPKGAAPHLAHDFAEQSVVCYTLCRRCPENTVAAGEGKGI